MPQTPFLLYLHSFSSPFSLLSSSSSSFLKPLVLILASLPLAVTPKLATPTHRWRHLTFTFRNNNSASLFLPSSINLDFSRGFCLYRSIVWQTFCNPLCTPLTFLYWPDLVYIGKTKSSLGTIFKTVGLWDTEVYV